MKEWRNKNLGSISIQIQTGPFGSQLHQSDYSDIGTPVIMPKDIVDGKISDDSIARVEEAHVNRLARHKVNEGDIIYPRRGDVRKCAYTVAEQSGWLCGTGCLRVTIDNKKAVPKYVFYHLQEEKTRGWIEKHAIGATMLNLNTSILSNIPLRIPRLDVQKKIATVLSRYDSLIDNYQKQIKLLEEAAQRLYKEWFVNLRFPGHENTKIVDGVPEGWEKKSVGDMLRRMERTKQVPSNEYLKRGEIPVIDQSRNFVAGYTNDEDSRLKVTTPVILFGDHTRVLKYLSFSFARGADGTQLIMSNDIDRLPQSLFYNALVEKDLSNYSYARHFKYLKAEQILVPTKEIAQKFDTFAAKIYEQIQSCRHQLRLLTESRDRLLPKLLSGEIEV